MKSRKPPRETGTRTALPGWWLTSIFLAAAVLLFWLPRVAQDQSYHDFADQRVILSIPNFWDVASNLPFAIVGALGVWLLRGVTARVLFTGHLLTCLGSGYYHLAPNDAHLVWDRLPMTLVFMALLTALIVEGRDSRWEGSILGLLLFFGVGSVWWWHATGNLLPYLLVQFGLMLVIIPALYRARGKRWLWGVTALYSAAKIVEIYDKSIYLVMPLSGHTLKHFLAAAAGYCIFRWYRETSRIDTRAVATTLFEV